MNVIKALILIISSTIGIQAVAELPTTKVFRKEIREHRVRVTDFGLLLIEKFPENFPILHSLHPAIRRMLAKDYFSLHDLPKVMSRQQLEKFGYEHRDTVLKRLHDVYGEDKRPDAVDDLNKTENELKSYVMGKRIAEEYSEAVQRLWHLILPELQLAELSADVGDTKNFRGRELGFKWERGSALKFLMSKGNRKAAIMAHWIQETEYRNPALPMCNNLLGIKPNGPEFKISK